MADIPINGAWIYVAVGAVIAGAYLRALRGIPYPTIAERARDVVIALILCFGWPLALLGALGGFLVFITKPSILPAFCNYAGSNPGDTQWQRWKRFRGHADRSR